MGTVHAAKRQTDRGTEYKPSIRDAAYVITCATVLVHLRST